MTVPEFEDYLRDQMLQEKFHQLVTDAITVTPAEVQQEFRRRNEKVQIEYVLIKPADLASTIQPTDAELSAYLHETHRPVPGSREAFGALRVARPCQTSRQHPGQRRCPPRLLQRAH